MPSNSSDTNVLGNPNVIISTPNGSISLDASASISAVAGVSAQVEVDGQIYDFAPFQLNLPPSSVLAIDGTQVLQSPFPPIANPAATLVSLQTQLIAVLDMMRGHGFLQT